MSTHNTGYMLRADAHGARNALPHLSRQSSSADLSVPNNSSLPPLVPSPDLCQTSVSSVALDLQVRTHPKQEVGDLRHAADDQDVAALPVGPLLLRTDEPVSQSPLHVDKNRLNAVGEGDADTFDMRFGDVPLAIQEPCQVGVERLLGHLAHVHSDSVVPLAVAVPCAEWIGRRIVNADALRQAA
jgi:hypothetical protein